MNDAELRDVLEAHGKWFRGEAGGSRANLIDANLSRANLFGANLIDANLSRANLIDANLDGANLIDANLGGANLFGANLGGANLGGANLGGANLTGANLFGANLFGANLDGANLFGANLTGANLGRADLDGANLDGANLGRANLSRANLGGAKATSLAMARTEIVPREGSFVGWKKLSGGHIAKLLIPENAKRSNACGRKCRASSARVVSIETRGGKKTRKRIASLHDRAFFYASGKVVSVENFDADRLNECAPGIHFYLTREEAEAHA